MSCFASLSENFGLHSVVVWDPLNYKVNLIAFEFLKGPYGCKMRNGRA